MTIPGSVFVQRIKPAAPEQVDDGIEVLHIGARSTAWYSGASVEPPALVPGPAPRRRRGGRGAGRGAGSARRSGIDEIVTLFSARGPEVAAVAEVADELRRQAVGDTVTFVHNRNINYTNVCTFKCRFCGFSKGPLSLNLRGTPYLLTLDDIAGRVREAAELGATEVCLQGGIHPSFDGDYYIDVTRAVKEAAPDMHVHGFTALGGHRGGPAARRAAHGRTWPACATPGCARCRARRPRSSTTSIRAAALPRQDQHRRVARGPPRRPLGRAQLQHHHHVRRRRAARSTGPATWCAPGPCRRRPAASPSSCRCPFVHMAAPIYLQHKSRRGPTFRETVLMHAVGRIAYHGWIDNIQVSWVKMGHGGVRQMLQAGVNDLGGTLMDENISRAAGASHGQGLEEADFRALVEPLGRTLEQRTTLYGRVRGRLSRGPPGPLPHRSRRARHPHRRADRGGRRQRQPGPGVRDGRVGHPHGPRGGRPRRPEAGQRRAQGAALQRSWCSSPTSDVPKVSIFGSARLTHDQPSYAMARDFGRAMVERDWMVITGAGPGIMEAGIEGAGPEQAFGVNIVLPFEQDASPLHGR